MDLKSMLDAQLRSRHASAAMSAGVNSNAAAEAPPALAVETKEEASAILAQCHDSIGVLGARPVTHTEIRSALGAVRRVLDATPFGLSSYQVPSDETLIKTIVDGYERDVAKLEPLYAALEAALAARGVAFDQLKVVTMVAAGGTPFREFGLGDSLKRGVEMQLALALNHGFIFNFIPTTFSDFNTHIVSMGVGVGAFLLAMLRARESGRVKMDGVMFACKGTLAAALAARAFVEDDGAAESRFNLFGMGTDLTQGFDDIDDETAKNCRACLGIVAMNSLQDTNVGHGEATRTGLEARAARVGGTAVWVDVDARLEEFGKFGNPEHGWYPAAFRRECCSAVKATILNECGSLVGASPCDVVVDASQAAIQAAQPAPASAPMSATEALRRRTSACDKAVRESQGPLVLSALLDYHAGSAKLNHAETRVTLLKDFVGNEMFVAE